MPEKILFTETQKFTQWWLWLILLGINAMFGYGMYKQLYLREIFGDNPMSNSGLIVVSLLMFLFSFFFYIMRLETFVKNDGIFVRFFPIQITFKKYNWETLTKCYVRKYSPISEYGGWGFRYGIFGSGKALNVSGNLGLQLEISNKSKLLIGTNKPEELNKVLKEINQIRQ